MTPKDELWAEALAVERLHGDHANAHVAERIVQLAIRGDEAGVARWKAIAERLDALSGAEGARQ